MLGRNGDILSILPCLQAEYRETGKKPVLVTSKDYSSWLKPLPWLVVEEFEGGFEKLGEAIRWAKALGKVDFIPQIHGENYPQPKRHHPSFQYDQWHRMGRLKQWGKLPLDLPRRLNQVSVAIMQPTILVADHSQSSPFPDIEDLVLALKQSFPGHHVLRLSSIRLPLLTDLLAHYDASDLLVTIDTAHAHLCKASTVPVIMLATDHPSTWHGSAYHPRFALHVRYKDYTLRKSELLWTAKKILTAGAQK